MTEVAALPRTANWQGCKTCTSVTGISSIQASGSSVAFPMYHTGIIASSGTIANCFDHSLPQLLPQLFPALVVPVFDRKPLALLQL